MPGFILTTTVFHQFMRQSNLPIYKALDKLKPSDYTLHRDHILSLPLDMNLEKTVRKHHKRLQGTVAVRSSMVGEDQPRASFAGQLDTFLNITTEELTTIHQKMLCLPL